MSRRRGDREATAKEVDRIQALDRVACLALWREIFGMQAPKRLSVEFMRRALAHEVQARAFGPMAKRTRRVLNARRFRPGRGRAASRDG